MAGNATTVATAERAGVPYTTARSWRRRFTSRAELLAAGFLAATVTSTRPGYYARTNLAWTLMPHHWACLRPGSALLEHNAQFR
jgi:hypothetical protein